MSHDSLSTAEEYQESPVFSRPAVVPSPSPPSELPSFFWWPPLWSARSLTAVGAEWGKAQHLAKCGTGLTCMTVNDSAALPELKTMWAEIKDQSVVIRKRSNSQVNDVRNFIDGLCVCVFLTGMKNWKIIKHYNHGHPHKINDIVRLTPQSDSWSRSWTHILRYCPGS